MQTIHYYYEDIVFGIRKYSMTNVMLTVNVSPKLIMT